MNDYFSSSIIDKIDDGSMIDPDFYTGQTLKRYANLGGCGIGKILWDNERLHSRRTDCGFLINFANFFKNYEPSGLSRETEKNIHFSWQ